MSNRLNITEAGQRLMIEALGSECMDLRICREGKNKFYFSFWSKGVKVADVARYTIYQGDSVEFKEYKFHANLTVT